ncbi:unnamed protein product [Fasciola hepatica]|uniref:Uncharacterized protein n=1 Tax=Fasciola hepatica TaxID=6192 RepID=A0ABC9HHS8_FASHE
MQAKGCKRIAAANFRKNSFHLRNPYLFWHPADHIELAKLLSLWKEIVDIENRPDNSVQQLRRGPHSIKLFQKDNTCFVQVSTLTTVAVDIKSVQVKDELHSSKVGKSSADYVTL